MSAKTFLPNAGATHQIKKVYLGDVAAVRKIKKIYVGDSGGTRLVFLLGSTFTLVSGGPEDGSQGYAGGSGGFGSLTPTTFNDGNTLIQLTSTVSTPRSLLLNITGSGLSASYFNTMTITYNGSTTAYASSAASYSGGSTNSIWLWSTGGYNLVPGETFTVFID